LVPTSRLHQNTDLQFFQKADFSVLFNFINNHYLNIPEGDNMSKSISLFILFFALIALPGFAQETFTNADAKVSITLPAGWMYESDENGIIAYPAEGGFAVHFNILGADDLSAALDEVDKMLSEQVTDLQLREGQAYEINGMSGVFVEGSADGILLAIGVIDTPVAGKSLMVGAWGAPETIEKYAADVQSIIHSISPAN
jgi:predicted Zn-dependent protease